MKLDRDISDLPRLPNEAYECFKNYFFYYLPKYPTRNILKQALWDPNRVPEYAEPHRYLNLDYKMMKFYHTVPAIKSYAEQLWFLVSSIDQKGIQSPLCSENLKTFHPGGKRYAIAGYLDIPTMPVLLQSTKKIQEYNSRQLHHLFEITNLYNNQCSMKVRKDTGALEVSWHGETSMRDNNGYDDWRKKADNVLSNTNTNTNFNIPKFLLQNGLDVVNKFRVGTKIDGIFKTNYCRKSNSPIKIIIDDIKYIDLDLWELYFHIDPTVHLKVDKSSYIQIVNEIASKDIVYNNCRLLETLTRKKIFTAETVLLNRKGR